MKRSYRTIIVYFDAMFACLSPCTSSLNESTRQSAYKDLLFEVPVCL